MPERRDLGKESRLDVVPRDENLDRLDPGCKRRVDEVFTLRDE
jgi:hypothetical protein